MNILIAGTSSGIGRFLATRLLEAGNHVWGFARSTGDALHHAQFRPFICDVSDWEQVFQLSTRIAEEIAPLRAIVICAAVQGPIGPAMAVDPQKWSASIRVNLDGTFNILRAFVPQLRSERNVRPKVLCFSGGGAAKSRPNFSAYAAAKAGVVRLVETLAEEWREIGVDINAIAPGPLPTRMTDEILRDGARTAGESEVTAARESASSGPENFERLGRLVDFLLSAESDGISGKLISALWDPWEKFGEQRERLRDTDLLTLRRITPEDRGKVW